ncbi:hypothetical protein [Butyrivibrio sp. WCD2001]|uniref:hypothetical protein n=1 Tax=Butyrivibrio sp. WCD2001 TaxID=1280681 RepID=UPI0004076230|nr:hypothetical protein [Butyrivibrio sp. WCD2001]
MNYGKGTIIFVRRTKFADNGQYDNRAGHPSMLPIASDDVSGDTYYLMLTSNVSKINAYPDKYYDLSDVWQDIPLERPSLINLQYIYKGRVEGGKLGGLWPQLYKDVIRELKRYQNEHPCECYEELKGKI